MTLGQFFTLLSDSLGSWGMAGLVIIIFIAVMKVVSVDRKKTYLALSVEADAWLQSEKAKPRCIVRLVLHSGEQFKTKPFEPEFEIVLANNSISKRTSKYLADREVRSATFKEQFKDGSGCTIPYANINYIKVEEV